ncbi:MAG: DEAD/DEAH box helicase [Gammaproteobacteria bacterium]|jgi:superfamily II DNA or RNA helicase|nr:DEAD/DEAH box helicase [Gammaproteobacteria bacterium]MBT4196456.1 DEAD/DEAH box helicase [Gammaproteobacteria bacterium]MBT4448577.1 DEAD/DEAH box helicase [Gammaproteobacteria bacterium]MBT6456018.1 DEAD/DEAH box helicase [Gammaproteobacteria bacterium]MBT6701087.1 DEAD/DEAH box helicase [Gammaproteobacteria bacterium]
MQVNIREALNITGAQAGVINSIISDNTYKNPAHAEAIKYNRSTRYISPQLTSYANINGCLIVPRGYLDSLPYVLTDFIDDRTLSPVNIPPLHNIQSRPYQQQAINQAIEKEQGLIIAPTGSGKTILGLSVIHKRQQRALILVHSKELAKQWQSEILKLMGIEAGLIGGGQWKEGEQITIAMLQTLGRNELKTSQIAEKYGLVLVDECHHIPANTFMKVIDLLPCKYRYGLTATPYRRDGLSILINRAIGNNLAQIKAEDVEQAGGITGAEILAIHTGCEYPELESWNDYLKEISNDQDRNNTISTAARILAGDAPTLILTDRIEHAENIYQACDEQALLIHGQLNKEQRTQAMQATRSAGLTIGTIGLLGEGLDVSCWTNLVLASPISSRARLLQAIGRVIRPHDGKEKGLIIDIVDDCAFSYSSHNKRLKIYTERQYPVSVKSFYEFLCEV